MVVIPAAQHAGPGKEKKPIELGLDVFCIATLT